MTGWKKEIKFEWHTQNTAEERPKNGQKDCGQLNSSQYFYFHFIFTVFFLFVGVVCIWCYHVLTSTAHLNIWSLSDNIHFIFSFRYFNFFLQRYNRKALRAKLRSSCLSRWGHRFIYSFSQNEMCIFCCERIFFRFLKFPLVQWKWSQTKKQRVLF